MHENERAMLLPARPGTYTLVLACQAERAIPIGRLGTLRVQPGYYVYVGSARGPGGLAARILRHARKDKTLHWHLDHRRQGTDLVEVWYTADKRQSECRWASVLLDMSGNVPLERFGASDCSCRSHLFFFPTMPSWRTFRRRIRQSAFGDSQVLCLAADQLGVGQARC